MTDTAAVTRLSAALVGRYVVEHEIGAGGMATVYLAEDLKHHRKVAIKVLKEELSASVSAARFLREIEIEARLQHPNILPVLDSGEADGLLYYVMPYVEGQSLRQRLERERELPIGEAVRVLVEIVDALACAHQHGVVHRDMKPDNVMLSGRHALVADFGVARAVSEATGRNFISTTGVALGTPAYMSPEQAVADPNVDQRADIYAVGVMAYELIAGRPPFTGITPQQVLASHVTETPDPLSKHRPGISAALETTIMRCLEKRPADRWQSADELLAALEPLATPSGGTHPTEARLPAAARAKGRGWTAAAIVAAVALTAVVFGARFIATRSPPALALGKQQQITSEPGLEIQPAISPDGKLVAYAAGNSARMRVFIRPVGGGRTIPLSDDSTAVEHAPRWSPDGSRLLFLAKGGVSVAPALGGSSRAVVPASASSEVWSATWSPDGAEIAFVRGDTLLAAPADGGPARALAHVPSVHSCSWSPAGRWLACVVENTYSVRIGSTFGNIAPSAVVTIPATGGPPQVIAEPASSNLSPIWSGNGNRLFFVSNRDGARDIYALDVTSSGRASGAPTRLTTGLGALNISVSGDDRVLAYDVYRAKSNLWSLPVPEGAPTTAAAATPITSGSQVIESERVSPDGRWIVYDSDLGGKTHIWRMPVQGGEPEQLTNGPADEFAADLSPDDRSVAYHSFRTGTRDIEVKPLDGGEVQRVTATPAQESYPRWSPDGVSLAFIDQSSPGGIYVTSRDAELKWSTPRLVSSAGSTPAWSPDGRSIACVHFRGVVGQALAVVPVEGGRERIVYQPSGVEPKPEFAEWSRDGRTLYFKAHDELGRASLWSIGAEGGRPRLLVHFEDLSRPSSRKDFATDGKRFYFPVEDRQSDVFVAELVKR